MGGNENSGRKSKFEEPVKIYFQIEKKDVDILNEMAKKYTNNSRSELILQILKRVINTYEGTK